MSREPSLRGQAAPRRARDPAAAARQGPALPRPRAAGRRPPALPELAGHAGGQGSGGAPGQPPAPGPLGPAVQPQLLLRDRLGLGDPPDRPGRRRGERGGAAAHQPVAHPPDAAEEQRAARPQHPQGEGVQGAGAHLRAGEGPPEEQHQERRRREESAADPQVEVQGAEGGAEAGRGGREEEAGGGGPTATRRRQRE